MHMRIGRTYKFDAGHRLEHHHGKCSRQHGHTYHMEVVVRGDLKDEPGASDDGMVMDFGELDDMVKPLIVARLDHYNMTVTAERLVLAIANELQPLIADSHAGLVRGARLEMVRLWETDDGYAEWRG